MVVTISEPKNNQLSQEQANPSNELKVLQEGLDQFQNSASGFESLLRVFAYVCQSDLFGVFFQPLQSEKISSVGFYTTTKKDEKSHEIELELGQIIASQQKGSKQSILEAGEFTSHVYHRSNSGIYYLCAQSFREDLTFRIALDRLIDKAELRVLDSKIVERNKQLEIAIESSSDGFWYINLKKNKVFFSEEWKSMLGFQDSELKNTFETFQALIHPDDRSKTLTELDPLARMNDGPFQCEYRLRHKLGGYRWILTQAYVGLDGNGIPSRLMATNINITSRVTYRKSLEQKEEEYSSLVNSVHEVIFKTDNQGVISFLNPAWEQVTGFNYKQCLQTSIKDYVYYDDKTLMDALLNSSIKNNEESKSINYEVRFLSMTKPFVWMHMYGTVEFDGLGHFSGLYGTLIDIHSRKEAELAHAQSDERFRVMSETMSDLIALHKLDGSFYHLSPSIKGLMGFEPEEMLGKTPEDFVHPEDLSQFLQGVIKPLSKGEIKKMTGQMRVKRSNGSYLWIESVIQPMYTDGQIDSLLSVSRDVSERKRAEIEMQKALKKEKELSELRSRFITMASHEFRTPLTSIKSSVQLLEMYADEISSELRNPMYNHMGKISVQIDRLTDLMEDILVVGKSQAKKMPFDAERTDFVLFCKDLIEQNFTYREGERTIEMDVIGDKREVMIDPGLMQQVMNNTISNAFKYSRDRPDPKLKLTFSESQLRVEVMDFGIGVPKAEQEQIFQSFYRANNAADIEGTGLGLVITKQFVEMHGGTIDFKSKENAGTIIDIHLPV